MFEFCPKLIQFNIQFNIVSRKFNSKVYSIQNHFKKIQFKKLFICQFFKKIQFKNLFIFLFFTKFNSKIYSFLIFFIKIQFKNLFKIMKLAVFNSIKYSFNKKTRVSDRATRRSLGSPGGPGLGPSATGWSNWVGRIHIMCLGPF